MGCPPPGGARRHQRGVGELPVGTRAGRSARRSLERAHSPEFASLLRHGADVDHGHVADAIHRLGGLFFLAKLAESGWGRPGFKGQGKALFCLAARQLDGGRAGVPDQGPDCPGRADGVRGHVGHSPRAGGREQKNAAGRGGRRLVPVRRFGGAVVLADFRTLPTGVAIHDFRAARRAHPGHHG